jgi:UDP-N-acetylmuramoyl-tripeptide--D-alanyl-D-alanine ligase
LTTTIFFLATDPPTPLFCRWGSSVFIIHQNTYNGRPMSRIDKIWDKLVANGFKVSTDTRKDVTHSIFFALKGKNYDGATFAQEALVKGAMAVVTDNALEVLQRLARRYRDTFNIPIIAIGGSNGKTTTKELIRLVLSTRYKVYATEENLNNHIGVPLSIFSMDKSSEVGIFEIGANHLGEHTSLLEILNPTHVIVTNSGMDHLEGFGSPDGVIKANEEINEWARSHGATILTNTDQDLEITTSLPLVIIKDNKEYKMQMVGDYNLENINRALNVALIFKIDRDRALEAMTHYTPRSQRSELLVRDDINFIVDCYNANPTSMMLALESFIKSAKQPRGVILGDMLELGSYTDEEHKKIVEFITKQKIDTVVFIGKHFKQALNKMGFKNLWFPDSDSAREWLEKQDFTNYTLLLKGSRGIKVERVMNV